MFFQEVNTRQLMQLRQVQGLEGDFGQVNWHLTQTQGAKILEKLSSVMCRFLQICMVVLDYFCSQKVRKYWRTSPLRCVRFFEDHRPSNFGNHPKSLECFGKRRTKASSGSRESPRLTVQRCFCPIIFSRKFGQQMLLWQRWLCSTVDLRNVT